MRLYNIANRSLHTRHSHQRFDSRQCGEKFAIGSTSQRPTRVIQACALVLKHGNCRHSVHVASYASRFFESVPGFQTRRVAPATTERDIDLSADSIISVWRQVRLGE